MDLALTLVRRHEERQNYVAAFNIMRSSTVSKSLECTEESNELHSHENDQFEEQENIISEKMWTSQRTLLLISLVKKYEKDFETALKKTLWKKIAAEISERTGIFITSQQCDTKCKALKNHYKNIKKHNSTTGNDPIFWIFFDAVDEILNVKPEINPIAVSSNRDGLIRNELLEELSTTPNRSCSKSPISILLKRQRKTENSIERRHRERLDRQNRFLTLFERMTKAIENISPQTHNTV